MVTLAVGIAAPSAMFGLLGGITSSLPSDVDRRVIRVSLGDRTGRVSAIPWPLFEAWSEGATGDDRDLVAMAAFQSDGGVAVVGGEVGPSRQWGVYATADLFSVLDVTPVVGRIYDGEVSDGAPSVLIREDVWVTRFDRDPGAIGRTLRVDGVEHVIVGILPRDFGFPTDQSVWMEPSPGADPAWGVVGRLGRRASPEVAREQLEAIRSALPPAGAAASPPPTTRVETYTSAHWGRTDDTLRNVALMTITLLFVAALSVAMVVLARGMSRSRETAIRRALGATRSQIVAQTVGEVLVLALGGALLGLLLGHWGVQSIVQFLARRATIIPYWMDFGIGAQSVLSALGFALLAVTIGGIIPAVRSSGVDLEGVLRAGGGEGPKGSGRLMRFAVGAEMVLSSALLIISGTSVAHEVLSRQTGRAFDTSDLLTGRFVLEEVDYPDDDARRSFLIGLLDALRDQPSVEGASLTTSLPGQKGTALTVNLVGVDEVAAGRAVAQVRIVDAGFLPTLGSAALRGRLLSDTDGPDGELVAVVNEAFVRSRAIGDGAVGRRIELPAAGGEREEVTIVGVVDDLGVTPHVRGQPSPGVYLSVRQRVPRSSSVVMTMRDGASVREVWQEAVSSLDPNLPLGEVRTLDEALLRGRSGETLFLSVFVALGGITFLIAVVGLYGVQSFLIARRIRDIGVRRALGARRARVMLESALKGLRPVFAGVILGVVPGFVIAQSVVPGPYPMLAYLLPPILLVATSVAAIWRPTRRASRTDPMVALRAE